MVRSNNRDIEMKISQNFRYEMKDKSSFAWQGLGRVFP